MSAKNMAERSVEKRLVEGVEALGGVTMKLEVPGSRFWPDRLLIGPNGQVVFVELKTDAGRLSRGQDARIAQLRALNHMVAVLLYRFLKLFLSLSTINDYKVVQPVLFKHG